ncbi:MAG: PQQ-binding-like beta-propeller repeat protein [Rubripirellula sp.]|nr:PQQ-binding-like beta-propeller repeat protein [Rubripirellula sp.]
MPRISLAEKSGQLEGCLPLVIESWGKSILNERVYLMSDWRNRCLLSLLVGVMTQLFFTQILGSGALAQGLFRPMQNVPPGRFLDLPRSLQQTLREAEESIEQGQYSDAVLRLGELASGDYSQSTLGELEGQDFFLSREVSLPPERPVATSFLKRVRFLLGTLPEEAIATYELRYGPLARKTLLEAAENRDWQGVGEVRRMFFHTLAGYEASFVLAQRAMLLGHPLEASLYLADLIPSDRAVSHLGDSVLCMYAAACASSNQELSPQGFLNRFDAGPIQVQVGGNSYRFSSMEELSAWAKDRFSPKPSSATELPKEDVWVKQQEAFTLFGGDPSRNRAVGGQLPLSTERWRLSTTASPLQERTLRQDVEELRTSGRLPPPSWVPLKVGGQVLMRTTERLVGVDHRTGKRIWTYPWHLGDEVIQEEASPLDAMFQEQKRPPLLSQRVWNDVPYGQVSSDGKQVYLLDQLGQLESVTMNAMLNMRGVRRVQSQYNTLVALDLEKQGKLRWRIGSQGDPGSALTDAFFLGPPLPIDGRLYVMAEIAGDICLCCLDPANGDELWRQQLVTVESGGVQTDPIRRVAGAMPTYHEGVLVCPTGAGAIVGVDLVDRTLRWGATVERNAEMYRTINGSGRGLEGAKLMQRWHNGAALVEGATVLVTPIESDRLYALDLRSGERLFAEKNRVHMMYVAGIQDGKFIVVGTHQIRAFDVNTGDAVWTTARDLVTVGQQISGLGVFGAFDYFVPTTTNEIIQVSLADGTVRQRRETQYPLGNLVAVDGELITQSPTSLAVAYGQSTLQPEVDQRLAEDPEDFTAMIRKSELLIQEGDLTAALEYLDRARKMRPEDDEVRTLSVAALLGQLRANQSMDSSLVDVLGSLIDRPRQRVELLGLQVRAAIATKDYENAINRLLELSSLVASDSLLDSSDLALADDSTLKTSLDSWIAARAEQVATSVSQTQLDDVNAMLLAESQTLRAGSDHLIRTTLSHFNSFAGVDPLRGELAERLVEREDAVGLERLGWGRFLPGEKALERLPIGQLQLLVKAYELGKMPKDQASVLHTLAQRTDGPIGDQTDDLWLASPQQITQRLDELERATLKPVWPKDVSLTWDARTTRIIRSLSQTQRFSELQPLAGKQMSGWRLYGEGSSPLSLMSPFGMRLRIAVDGDVSEAEKTAVISGGVMVVVTRTDLIAVNLLALLSGVGDPVLWQRPITGDGGLPMGRRSSVTPFDDKIVRYAVDNTMTSAVIPEFALGPILGDRVIVLQGGDLIALDLLTAETLWRNASAPPSGAVVSDGNRIAVVSDATNVVKFFDPLDGQALASEEWDGGEIWSSLGSNVLSYKATDIPEQYSIQLSNPLTGEVLLEHLAMKANRDITGEGETTTYGRVESSRFLNLYSSDGEVLIWDLVEGVELSRLKFQPFPALSGLSVMQMGDKMVLLPRAKNLPSQDPTTPQVQTSDGRYHVAVDRLHAIDLASGQLMWERQLESTWGCTITQPAETPLIILARSPFAFSTVNRTRRKDMDVLAVSAFTGETAQLTEGRAVLSGNKQLETKVMIQPNGQRLLVEVGVEHLLYQFGESDAAEAAEGALGLPNGPGTE